MSDFLSKQEEQVWNATFGAHYQYCCDTALSVLMANRAVRALRAAKEANPNVGYVLDDFKVARV